MMKQDITYVAFDGNKKSMIAGILQPKVTDYEAGPSGYDLYRQLTALGVLCQVMGADSPPGQFTLTVSLPGR